MAWISVHEQVNGMKLRELSKCIKCSQKEALGILVSLWLWGINNAAKDGELKGADRFDIQDALSTGLSAGLSAEKIVECLIEKQWIDEKDNVFYLHDWDIWQEQWYKALERRAYDASRKREERKNKGNESPTDSPQDNPTDSPTENPVQPSPSPSPSPKLTNKDIDDYFENIWRLYPKKEGKGQVSKSQKEKLYKLGYDKIKACVDAYKKAKAGTDRQYLQNGSTFFNSGYIDYLDQEEKQAIKKIGPVVVLPREGERYEYSSGT